MGTLQVIKIKRLTALLALVFLPLGMQAQQGYFNTSVGTTLKWVIYDNSGSVFGYCHEKLTGLKGNMKYGEASYAYMFYDNKYKSVIGDKPFEFYVTIENGVTRAYVNNISKARKSGDYMPLADISSIPDDIKAGDKLSDTEISVKVLTVVTIKNQYVNRSVKLRESVTVPAGTFDCYLVEDHETLNGNGPFRVQTWVAKGIGIVRQVIYKTDGSVNQIFELTK